MTKAPKSKADLKIVPKAKPAPAGHNTPELSDAERRARLYRHFDICSPLRDAAKEAQAAYQSARKRARAEIILSDLDHMFRIVDTKDESIITERQRRELEISMWMNQPVNFQPDMFGRDPREPDVDRAARAGRAAGWRGDAKKSGYGPQTDQDRAWMSAWDDGNEERHAAMATAMVKTEEARQTGARSLMQTVKDGVGEPEPPFPPEPSDEELRQSAPQF